MRKNFTGDRDTAIDYIGEAKQQLAILKNMMGFNQLTTLSRVIDYPGGVRITVASIHGQDFISVDAPPAALPDVIEQAQGRYERTADRRFLTTKPKDIVYSSGSVTIEITPPPLIYIGGSRGNYPQYWASDSGLHSLGLRESYNETRGDIFALSPNGQYPIGSVTVYDSTINPATIFPPINKGLPYGNVEHAAVWRSGPYSTGDADIAPWNNAGPQGWSRSYRMSADLGTVYGNTGGTGGFRWNGHSGSGLITGQAMQSAPGTTSSDGRVTVSGNTYQLDGGTPIAWGPYDCYGTCVVCIPQAVKTLVFSG